MSVNGVETSIITCLSGRTNQATLYLGLSSFILLGAGLGPGFVIDRRGVENYQGRHFRPQTCVEASRVYLRTRETTLTVRLQAHE
jgi:hypothetical protein